MTAPVRHLLDLYDALPGPDKQVAAAEIIRRLPDDGPLPDAAFVELAEELFVAYDAAEAAGAAPPR